MTPAFVPFATGLLLAFLPSYAPFLGAIYFLSSRFRPYRNDVWWLLAAVLMSTPAFINQSFATGGISFLQVLAVWLIYRTFSSIPRLDEALRRRLFIGLLTGLFLVVVLGWLQIEQLNFAYRSVVQAIVWDGNPTLYGHSVLALGVAIATLSPSLRQKIQVLALSALGILVSGSREAGLAWLVFAVAMPFLDSQLRSVRQRLMLLGTTAVMLAVVAGLGAFIGWGTSGFLIDIVPALSDERNLIQSSELPSSDWWYRQQVDVSTEEVKIDDQLLTAYLITKKSADSWARLQQIVSLEPSSSYTVSTWIHGPENATRPGIQGWASLPDGTLFTLVSDLTSEGFQVHLQGPGKVIDSGVADVSGNWQRVYLTFEYLGESTAHWYVGLAPDERSVTNTTARFAGFQIMQTDQLADYIPGGASKGAGLDVSRLPYWDAAWQGFLKYPVLGSTQDFPEYFEEQWPERQRFHVTPAHAHSFPLQLAYERGIFGVLGAVLLLLALLGPTVQHRDWLSFMAVFVVLLANIFDLTFLYGGVIYPLAALVGWRRNVGAVEVPANRESYRTLLNRTLLAAGDILAASAAIAVASWLSARIGMGTGNPSLLSGNLIYVLLLWPVLVLREGIYPGYGIPAHLELKKHVTAISLAWLIVTAAGLLFFGQGDEWLLATLLLLLPLTLLFLPVVRALIKHVLLRLDRWGERVVIIGQDSEVANIAEMLKRNPGFGYAPVALFKTMESYKNTNMSVSETLQQAVDYATDNGLSHAIVALSSGFSVDPAVLTGTTVSPFRKVEFIPDLGELPVYSVTASSIDNIFALQVRNELLSPSKQLYKRIIDVAGALLGGLLISPILIGLAIAVAVDSRGPVFFGHTRIGRHGRRFQAWKFRSMVKDADKALELHLERHPELRAEWDATQKLQNDPRVTRVGHFLRKYSLDELPQLWNVLLGEMSLVGPRPIVADEIPRYRDAFEMYKAVVPGMTGYWQVSGRSDTDYDQRVALDSFYVRNWSIWLDIVIILRTFKVVLKGDGAY